MGKLRRLILRSIVPAMILAALWACDDPPAHGYAPRTPRDSLLLHHHNDTIPFPKIRYRSVRAFTVSPGMPPARIPRLFHADGSLSRWLNGPGVELSPAHRADLRTALAWPNIGYAELRRACHRPRHALIWFDGDRPVASVSVSFSCRTLRFRPEANILAGRGGLERLRLIIRELGMCGENICNW